MRETHINLILQAYKNKDFKQALRITKWLPDKKVTGGYIVNDADFNYFEILLQNIGQFSKAQQEIAKLLHALKDSQTSFGTVTSKAISTHWNGIKGDYQELPANLLENTQLPQRGRLAVLEKKNIASMIDSYRHLKKVTVTQVCAYAKISASTFNRIINSEMKIPVSLFETLASALALDPTEILNNSTFNRDLPASIYAEIQAVPLRFSTLETMVEELKRLQSQDWLSPNQKLMDSYKLTALMAGWFQGALTNDDNLMGEYAEQIFAIMSHYRGLTFSDKQFVGQVSSSFTLKQFQQIFAVPMRRYGLNQLKNSAVTNPKNDIVFYYQYVDMAIKSENREKLLAILIQSIVAIENIDYGISFFGLLLFKELKQVVMTGEKLPEDQTSITIFTTVIGDLRPAEVAEYQNMYQEIFADLETMMKHFQPSS